MGFEKVRDDEEFPTEEVLVAVVSMDGANALARSIRKVQPTERPQDAKSGSRKTSDNI